MIRMGGVAENNQNRKFWGFWELHELLEQDLLQRFWRKTPFQSWVNCLWHKEYAVCRDKVKAWPLCRSVSFLQVNISWTSSQQWLGRSWRWRWCLNLIWEMSWSPFSTTWWTGSKDAVAILSRYCMLLFHWNQFTNSELFNLGFNC